MRNSFRHKLLHSRVLQGAPRSLFVCTINKVLRGWCDLTASLFPLYHHSFRSAPPLQTSWDSIRLFTSSSFHLQAVTEAALNMRSTSSVAISALLFLSVQATPDHVFSAKNYNRPGPSTATEVFSVKPLRGMPVANRPGPKASSSSRSVVSLHSTTQVSSKAIATPSPPSTTATSSSKPTSQPSAVSYVSKKKGLGFNTNSYLNGFGNSLAWCYNWANAPWGSIPAGVEFTPML